MFNQIIFKMSIRSKVGLIASIFSKVCSILWAKLSMYVFPIFHAEALIVKIEYYPQGSIGVKMAI